MSTDHHTVNDIIAKAPEQELQRTTSRNISDHSRHSMFHEIFQRGKEEDEEGAQETTEELESSEETAHQSQSEKQTIPHSDIELTWAPLFSHPALQRTHLTQVEQTNPSPPRLLHPQPQRPDQLFPPILQEHEESYQGHPPAYQPFPPEMEEEAQSPPSPVVLQPVYVVDLKCCNCGHKWDTQMLEAFLDEAPLAAVRVAPSPPVIGFQGENFQGNNFPIQNYPGQGLQGNNFGNFPGHGFQGNYNFGNYPAYGYQGNFGNFPGHGFQGHFGNYPGYGFQGFNQGPMFPANTFHGQGPYFPGDAFEQYHQGPSFQGFNQGQGPFWRPFQGPNFPGQNFQGPNYPGQNFQGVAQDPFNQDLFNRPSHDFLGALPQNHGQYQAPFQNNMGHFQDFGNFQGRPVEIQPPVPDLPPSERPLSLSSEEESEEEYDDDDDDDDYDYDESYEYEEVSEEPSEELSVYDIPSERITPPMVEHAVLRALQLQAGSNPCSPDLDEEECCNIIYGFFKEQLPVPDFFPLQGPYRELHWSKFFPLSEEEVYPAEAVDVSDPEDFFHDSEYESDEEFYRPRSRTFDDLSDDESFYDTAVESPGDFFEDGFTTAYEFFEEELLSSCLSSLSSFDDFSVEPQPAPVLTAIEKARFKRFTKSLNKKPQASTVGFSMRDNPFSALPVEVIFQKPRRTEWVYLKTDFRFSEPSAELSA